MLKKDFNYLIGLDVTLPDLLIAKQQVKNRNNTDFILADAKHLPFKDFSADIILCSEVLEHLQNPLKALSELSRISRDKLLLTVPILGISRNIARILQYSSRISEIEANIGHVSMHTSEQWIHAVKKTFGKRKTKYYVKAEYLYIAAEPLTSIFANLKNMTLLKTMDIALNIFETGLAHLKFANQLIITVSS